MLPLLLVLVLTQRRSARSALAKGFSLVALALGGLSAAISGWSVFTVYPKFLAHLRTQSFAGITPQAMANFRGLTSFLFHRDQSLWAVAAVSILSAAALIKTLTGWKHVRLAPYLSLDLSPVEPVEFDVAFANTVLFALLVSYHLNPHDLSLLLLPMVLLLRDTARTTLTNSSRRLIIALSAVLFLPPLHLLALRAHAYALVSIPLIALFAVSTFWGAEKTRKAGSALLS